MAGVDPSNAFLNIRLGKMIEPGTLIVMDPERGTKEGREALRKMVPDQLGVEEIQTPLFRNRIVYRVFQC